MSDLAPKIANMIDCLCNRAVHTDVPMGEMSSISEQQTVCKHTRSLRYNLTSALTARNHHPQ